MQSFIFVASLFVIVKSADYFTQSAERIGLYIGLSPFIIGTVILSIGTSLPELATSIAAVLQHQSNIVVADVVGSNTTNILLVVGISIVFSKKTTLDHNASLVDLPILVASAFFVYLSFIRKSLNLTQGIFFLLALVVYISYATSTKKISLEENGNKLRLKDILMLILSIVLLNFGSKYTIKSVVQITTILNISPGVIAATAIALGTSLPELLVSITAARKGKLDIAIGNVIGSNIFNAFGVIGISSIFGEIHIGQSTAKIGIPYMLVSTLLLVFVVQNKKLSKWVGLIFLILYFYYIYQLFS